MMFALFWSVWIQATATTRPVLLSAGSSRGLTNTLANHAGLVARHAEFTVFADGEILSKVPREIAGAHVILVQGSTKPVSDRLLEFWLTADAVSRVGPKKVDAVIPYLPYSRQDRIGKIGESLGASMIARFHRGRLHNIYTVDLHAEQIAGFYDEACVSLEPQQAFAEAIQGQLDLSETVVVAPDLGAQARALKLAKALGVPIVLMHKIRTKPNEVASLTLLGEVKGKQVILFDDIIDTAGTLIASATALKEAGAMKIVAAATHGLFNNHALSRIEGSVIEHVWVSDTLDPVEWGFDPHKHPFITIVSIGELIARAILEREPHGI
jgi:ribose-phosphate pyrophosphokinase